MYAACYGTGCAFIANGSPRAHGPVKVREVSSGQAKWRSKQPGRRRKEGHLFFSLILGQSVGLDTKFGDKIAGLITG